MKFRYDKDVDALYIYLKKGKYSHSEPVTDGIVVDVTKSGQPIGIEILDATKNIAEFSPGKLDVSLGKFSFI